MRDRLAWQGAWGVGFAAAMAIGWGCGEQSSASDCPVGSLDCPCTVGDGCDPGLSCVGETCRVIDNGTSSATTDGSATQTSGETMSGSQSGSATSTGTPATSSGTGQTDSASATDSGPLLDVGSRDTDIGPLSGCQAVDVLFVLDGSGSMTEERNALAAQRSPRSSGPSRDSTGAASTTASQ